MADEAVNRHAQHLQNPITKHSYAYGALDYAVKSFLDGAVSEEFLRTTHQQLRDGLAEAKAEQDTAVES